MAVRGAKLLEPTFERYQGKKGRLSIQTNPVNYRNADAIAEQAIHFNTLAPNMQVKIPVTCAGVQAIEEATYQRRQRQRHCLLHGARRCIAVAEAVERGLRRREPKGLDISQMSPVCTMMIGRTDDWMQVLAKRDGIDIDPAYPTWAGIAVLQEDVRHLPASAATAPVRWPLPTGTSATGRS